MREILFRAIPVGKKKLIYGFYAQIGGRDVIIKVESENYWNENLKKCNGNEVVEIKPETVGRHAGYTDIGSKKIFENDIVRFIDEYGEYKGIAKYGEYANISDINKINLGFYIEWEEKMRGMLRPEFLFWVNEGEIEVVGNIYDNKEMVK